jgi:hypothetical protein
MTFKIYKPIAKGLPVIIITERKIKVPISSTKNLIKPFIIL